MGAGEHLRSNRAARRHRPHAVLGRRYRTRCRSFHDLARRSHRTSPLSSHSVPVPHARAGAMQTRRRRVALRGVDVPAPLETKESVAHETSCANYPHRRARDACA
jgi:hypothetical protein